MLEKKQAVSNKIFKQNDFLNLWGQQDSDHWSSNRSLQPLITWNVLKV